MRWQELLVHFVHIVTLPDLELEVGDLTESECVYVWEIDRSIESYGEGQRTEREREREREQPVPTSHYTA